MNMRSAATRCGHGIVRRNGFRAGQDFRASPLPLVPPSHPLQKALEDWGASIEKASNGASNTRSILAAARQGVRSLRHGARRHRRRDLCEPRLSARPLPDHDAAICRSWFRMPRKGPARSTSGIAKYAEKEMKDVKFCFAFFHAPARFHSKTKKIVRAGRHQGQ